jgi:prepilin-type N-terminal cleavage/methylation domain-containing protein
VNERWEKTPSSGFTLVELLVVLAIIGVIMTVTLTSQGSFNKTLILSNTAYDIALTIRSAETYGLSSRASGAVANSGYGINFTTTAPDTVTLFADAYPIPGVTTVCHANPDPTAPDARPGDCAYQSSQGELVTSYKLGNAITITDFCAQSSGVWSCTYAHGGYGGGLASLDLVFVRPDPNPFMSVNGAYSSLSPVTRACLTISSRQGGSRYISVSSSGQISASAASCP